MTGTIRTIGQVCAALAVLGLGGLAGVPLPFGVIAGGTVGLVFRRFGPFRSAAHRDLAALDTTPVQRVVRWADRTGRTSLQVSTAILVAAVARLLGIPIVPAVCAGACIGLVTRKIGPIRRTDPPAWSRLAVFALLLALLTSTSWSYTGYLTAEGAAPFGVRTADWMRDHGMSPVVDQIELHLYGRNAPTNGPVQTSQLPEVSVNATVALMGTSTPMNAPAPIASLIDNSLAGEGLWTPNNRLVDGQPVTYTTYFRPDPAHTKVVAGAVWIDPATTRLVSVPGTQQPGGDTWAWNSGVPPADRAGLIAAFNSGFKFKDTNSGVFTEGRTPFPLLDGQASLVIYSDGHSDIGAWGTDVSMTPEVISVRQNLQLIVSNGRPVDGLTTSIEGEWGKRMWQLQFTQRSGIGVTADGALVYVAGSKLTTETLANALAQAGAVRGMELDIHTKQITFNFFDPAPNTPEGVTGTKLLPDMQREADRYLLPDQRDFFAVVLK